MFIWALAVILNTWVLLWVRSEDVNTGLYGQTVTDGGCKPRWRWTQPVGYL